MTNAQSLTAEQALQLHKQFLLDILQDMMKVFETGDAGVARMIRGLQVYWDSNHQRSATRRMVHGVLSGTHHENNAETMGRPFLMMLRAELQASNIQNVETLAQEIYDEAREIAVTEAMSGESDEDRREKLIAHINAAN